MCFPASGASACLLTASSSWGRCGHPQSPLGSWSGWKHRDPPKEPRHPEFQRGDPGTHRPGRAPFPQQPGPRTLSRAPSVSPEENRKSRTVGGDKIKDRGREGALAGAPASAPRWYLGGSGGFLARSHPWGARTSDPTAPVGERRRAHSPQSRSWAPTAVLRGSAPAAETCEARPVGT